MSRDSYHHGDLKAAILAQAAELVAERGADGISLRELARAAGVSHAAPAHHFTDRRGLFTALAAEGWRKLAAALDGARPEFIDAAMAYVRFALDHPGHYAVMFDRSLVDPENAELIAAQDAAGAELARGVGTLDDARAKEDPRRRRAGGMVSGARVFAAVAQQGDRRRRRSDGDGAPSRGDAFQERVACGA